MNVNCSAIRFSKNNNTIQAISTSPHGFRGCEGARLGIVSLLLILFLLLFSVSRCSFFTHLFVSEIRELSWTSLLYLFLSNHFPKSSQLMSRLFCLQCFCQSLCLSVAISPSVCLSSGFFHLFPEHYLHLPNIYSCLPLILSPCVVREGLKTTKSLTHLASHDLIRMKCKLHDMVFEVSHLALAPPWTSFFSLCPAQAGNFQSQWALHASWQSFP